jgi:hypothetical protein
MKDRTTLRQVHPLDLNGILLGMIICMPCVYFIVSIMSFVYLHLSCDSIEINVMKCSSIGTIVLSCSLVKVSEHFENNCWIVCDPNVVLGEESEWVESSRACSLTFICSFLFVEYMRTTTAILTISVSIEQKGHKQASKQASKQTNKRTNERTNERASEQANEWKREATNGEKKERGRWWHEEKCHSYFFCFIGRVPLAVETRSGRQSDEFTIDETSFFFLFLLLSSLPIPLNETAQRTKETTL